MPVQGPLVRAEVVVVGDQALVKLVNRTGSRVVFDVGSERVTVDGNTTGALVVPLADGLAPTVTTNGKVVPT